jgi:hypothetical protein
MTARIQRSFEFLAGVHFGSEFFTNKYNVDIHFNVESESIDEQNVALERIKYFLDDCLQHSILIHTNETRLIEQLYNLNFKLCTLPEEPYDQIVNIMLFQKINALTEGRLVITDISTTSDMSDGVTCFHSYDENVGPLKLKGWWNDNTVKTTDYKPKGKKVVKLTKTSFDWEEVGLSWQIPVTKDTTTTEILFASFEKLDK